MKPIWDDSGPGKMSLTSTVPSGVPSLRHNSPPGEASDAGARSSTEPSPRDCQIAAVDAPASSGSDWNSRAFVVPAGVPSLRHNSTENATSYDVRANAVKKTRLPLATGGKIP